MLRNCCRYAITVFLLTAPVSREIFGRAPKTSRKNVRTFGGLFRLLGNALPCFARQR